MLSLSKETRSRQSVQSNDWWGHIISECLSLDLENSNEKERVKNIANIWLKSGSFKGTKKRDDSGHERPGVIVGTWAKSSISGSVDPSVD